MSTLVQRVLTILQEWAEAPNDITSVPWWAITVESKIGRRGEIMLAGPYFSRADAESYLKSRHYRFPKNARVYCFSGHESQRFSELSYAARALATLRAETLPGAESKEETKQ